MLQPPWNIETGVPQLEGDGLPELMSEGMARRNNQHNL